MQLNIRAKFNVLLTALIFSGCATFEPGFRAQDMTGPRQPTAKKVQQGLDVSVEEFVTPEKSRQAFDADIAPYGILALLIRVENGGNDNYRIQRDHIKAFLGEQSLSPLLGKQAAGEAANREYVGKALGWTVATGPFAILLWPVTIAGSASHTRSVNRRIEQHFESLSFTDALLRPNQVAAGFAYFKLPDGVKKLQNLTVQVEASNEQNGNKITSKLSLPTLELSGSVSTQVVEEETEEKSSEEK